MRLKHHHYAPAKTFKRRERGADFSGVVAVIVHHRNAVLFANLFKSAADTAEIRKALPYVLIRKAQLHRNGNH